MFTLNLVVPGVCPDTACRHPPQQKPQGMHKLDDCNGMVEVVANLGGSRLGWSTKVRKGS